MRTIATIVAAVAAIFIPGKLLNAQWVQTGLKNTEVGCFAVSGNSLFAGGWSSGVFRSTDAGATWAPIDSGMTIPAVNALAVLDTNLFAGTYSGVYRSTNAGASWYAVNTGLPGPNFATISALVVSGTNIFAGNWGEGVFLSSTNGESWTEADSGMTNKSVNSLAVSGASVFAGTDFGGIFLSTNNGARWKKVVNGFADTSVFTLALGVSGSTVFASTIFGAVYVSTNEGTRWTRVDTTSKMSAIYAFASSGSNIFAGGSYGGAFLSTDNGGTWSVVNNGLVNNRVLALAVSGAYLFAGTDSSGVWRRPIHEMITSAHNAPTDLHVHVSLEQNYPNPISPATTISFTIPFRSFVSLKIFDALGKEVASLVEAELPAGTHSYNWKAAGVKSGVYYYRIQGKDFLETKQLIILR
jgi:photosystem II stability/assembly factor-like uncharacterized protein